MLLPSLMMSVPVTTPDGRPSSKKARRMNTGGSGSFSIYGLLVSFIGIALVLSPSSLVVVDAAVSCTSDADCESTLRMGSKCDVTDGLCTNPFHYGGCLANYLPPSEKWNRKRICSSQDDPIDSIMINGSSSGGAACRVPPIDEYMEIRIGSENWESVFFEAWILQIILSEMLDVPTSIETGFKDKNVDFYNLKSSLDYGKSSDWSALAKATEVGDCRKVNNQGVGTEDGNNDGEDEEVEDDYISCNHVIPEVWNPDGADVKELQSKGLIGPAQDLGALGEQHWFMPKFTALRDPSLTSYAGLMGEENRFKLAETFKRPTSWNDYCTIVSPNNCTSSSSSDTNATGADDGNVVVVAVRPPQDEEEGKKFFVDGLYTGHFRITDDSNCTLNPTTCTGHIADWPCSWLSYVKPVTHHLNIALTSTGPDEENGGYTYSQLLQIWAAANATKENVIIEWWSPDALYESYMGSDAEFTKITLPPPTQACIDARILRDNRCGDDIDFNLKVGDPIGACDYPPKSLKKLISGGFYDSVFDPNIPEALWSPAYDVVRNFHISDLQLNQMLSYWLERGTDKWNFDPRDAACRWVVENIELVESFIPQGHPRVVEEEQHWDQPVFEISRIISYMAASLVVLSCMLLYIQKNKRVMRLAQVDFLFLVLFGLLLVSIGAVLTSLPPTDKICIASTWTTTLGYTIEFIVVLAKMTAIHQLVSTGKGMQYVKLKAKSLYGWILAVSILLSVMLFFWTAVDPPSHEIQYELTEQMTSDNEVIINSISYCGSSSNYWRIFVLAWYSALLLSSAVLAMLATRVQEDVNDSRGLSLLIYSHLFFLGLNIFIYLVEDSVSRSDLRGYGGIIHGATCIVALLVYFIPKFCSKNVEEDNSSEHLPDLYLDTTIMFADIVGFTAWSSMREPSQVFMFLETIYHAFDEIAEKRKVFKVETVADCYVAATGLPKKRSDHAVVMAKFASDCIAKMLTLAKQLDVIYGPDTGDLNLRIGIHSGPVTGGFLKGKGARFQLFGDTMNTTSRIEESSQPGCIQCSEETAHILMRAGKRKWLIKREEKIYTRGKGELQTYWINLSKQGRISRRPSLGTSSHLSFVASSEDSFDLENDEIDPKKDREDGLGDRTNRLVDYNVEVLLRLLKLIVARRSYAEFKKQENQRKLERDTSDSFWRPTSTLESECDSTTSGMGMPLDEVKEIITLPAFDRKAAKRQREVDDVEIPPIAIAQLRDYVSCIAHLYRDNEFHNFDHASHVVTAVVKMMSRIIAPDIDNDETDNMKQHQSKTAAAASLHDHTYGITSDPLTQFACIFSALIHDVDHPGVPNPQFIKEHAELAELYKERSVAEQNSLDIAWNLLMEERFESFRETLCCNRRELSRFRQLVVNSVMATDLGDKELKALRNGRWDKAFNLNNQQDGKESQEQPVAVVVEDTNSNPHDEVNRKATIVIEHLLQAADVAHTKQHWQIYRKWNEKLFNEMYTAYRLGRAEKNPADFWFDGEIGFFTFYIIPLAKKLDNCGVFGISSDENLNYATKNLQEWKLKGKQVVTEILQKAVLRFNNNKMV